MINLNPFEQSSKCLNIDIGSEAMISSLVFQIFTVCLGPNRLMLLHPSYIISKFYNDSFIKVLNIQ